MSRQEANVQQPIGTKLTCGVCGAKMVISLKDQPDAKPISPFSFDCPSCGGTVKFDPATEGTA